MKRELVAVALTAALLMSLAAAASPVSPVALTVTGPDRLPDDRRATFVATSNPSEDVTIENYTLEVITTKTNESVNVTFAPNGTVLSVEPDEGIVGNHGIDAARINETINITRVKDPARAGYDRDGPPADAGPPDDGGPPEDAGASDSSRYLIRLESDAFVPGGDYALELNANSTDGETFTSNRKEFFVFERGSDDSA